MIENSCIPKVPNDLIEGKIDDYSYFLNPQGHHGAIVLFGDALKIIKHCTDKMDVSSLGLSLRGKIDNPERIREIILALGRLEILNLGDGFTMELMKERQKRKVKRMMVWVQITDTCNLCCPYCYIKKRPTIMGLDSAKRAIEKIIRDCENAGYHEVVFKLAGGEPVLRWTDCKSILDWAQSQFKNSVIRIKFHIITNGTILPPTLLGYLKDDRLGISVSLDGIRKWHDKTRRYHKGKSSFRDIETNLGRLSMAGISPHILTMVTRENVDGITELAEYCTVRDFSFRFSFYREVLDGLESLKNDNRRLIEALLQCYDWMADHLPKRSLYKFHQFGDVDLKMPKLRSCGIGKSGFTLSSNLNISLCQYDMSSPIGSIIYENCVDLLMKQTVYSLEKNYIDKISICKECKWRFVCGGGCPYLTKHHYGMFAHYSPYCEVYQTVLPKLVELHAFQTIRSFEQKNAKNGD